MKRLIIFLCLMMFGVANADFLGVKQASETISFFIKEPIDSAYGIPRLPDSVHIMTYADNASAATFQTRSTTYPFSDVSIDTLKVYGDTVYVFADQISDIDGAGGNFELAILVKMFTNGYYIETFNTVQIVSDSLENFLDASKDSSSSAAVLSKNNLDSLQAQDGWVAKEASLFDPTTDVVIADDTMSTGDSSGTKENQTSILAYFDTLIYVGPRGPGIYLDSAAANTNTVLGTDGTAKNPVSTIAAAKTLATALGYNRYYFLNASTFNDAANDIPSDHQNWEFIGIGNGNALAFGTQRVDESRFENMDLSGTMHASGGDVLYTNCTFGYITANFNGHAFNCLLADTIVVKADVDIEFVRCQSDVGGNRTPTIDLSGGASVVQLRGYSGGIRIMNGASNDTISVETDGQVIISANNTSLTITLRGMLTPTDSGTTTNLTKDAVFSRAEADLWIWANADTAHVDSSDQGVWLVNNLSGAAGGLDTLSTVFVDRLVGRNADTIWLSLLEARDGVAGSFGDSAQGWGATAASALDSAIISNILHRIVWGTAVGSGSDSSTQTQRDVDVHNMQGGVITVGDFATGAINADALAPNAVGASELAGDAAAKMADSMWLADFETHDGTAGSFGDSAQTWSGASAATWTSAQRDSVLRNMEDRAISLAKFDSTVVALLTEGIWLDDGAANTNTTVGIDGTITKPVSTLAAARILADSQSLQQYYLINNSSFTLDATYEDWIFLGIGRGNSINFGSQDTDNSDFYNLMITGTQGGTGTVLLDKCYLNTPDSLEALVTNSSLSDTISLRVSTSTVFDQCYSNIAGNTTPGLDLNSAGTIEVGVRHYSGGLTLFNGISTHTISFEETGQLVIDASCTSINVSARGNVKITDNGTTTALDDTAVFNTTQNIGVNWADIDNKTSIVDLTQTTIDTDQKVDLNTDQFYTIWSPSVSPLIMESAAAITDGSNTTLTFKTSLPIATDDWYNGHQIVFRYATSPDSITVLNIVDHTGSDSFVVIRPGLPTAPASGDSLWLLASRTAVEPLTDANVELALTAGGHAAIDYNNANSQIDGEDFTSAYYDSVALRSDSGLAAINNIVRVIAPHIGSVNDAAPTASQFVVSAGIGAYGDDYFNDLYLTFITGNLLGRTKRVTDFETTNDTIFTISFFSAPANGDSFSIGPGNFDILRDSTSYQGAAGALDSTAVYGAVEQLMADSIPTYASVFADTNWLSSLEARDGVAGSFGDSAQGWGATGAGGTGAFSCSLFTWDGASAITSGSVRMISGVNEYVLPIDANGWVELSLDGGTWTAYATALRFIQDTIPQTITFSTHHIDTITMTAFSPSTPTDTGKVVLYVWTDRVLGDTLQGATFRVIPLDKGKNWVTGGNRIMALGEVTQTTDSTGYAEIEVYQSSYTHPYPSGSDSLKYNISITYPGLSSWAQFRFVAPDSGNQYQIGVIE